MDSKTYDDLLAHFENTDKVYNGLLREKPNVTVSEGGNLSSVLWISFNWDATPEGFDFWQNVYNNLLGYEKPKESR